MKRLGANVSRAQVTTTRCSRRRGTSRYATRRSRRSQTSARLSRVGVTPERFPRSSSRTTSTAGTRGRARRGSRATRSQPRSGACGPATPAEDAAGTRTTADADRTEQGIDAPLPFVCRSRHSLGMWFAGLATFCLSQFPDPFLVSAAVTPCDFLFMPGQGSFAAQTAQVCHLSVAFCPNFFLFRAAFGRPLPGRHDRLSRPPGLRPLICLVQGRPLEGHPFYSKARPV